MSGAGVGQFSSVILIERGESEEHPSPVKFKELNLSSPGATLVKVQGIEMGSAGRINTIFNHREGDSKPLTTTGKTSRSPRLRTRALAASAALTLAGAALVSCGVTPNAAAGGEDGTIKVVASTTQICDYVTQLGVSDIDLTCLLAPNASAHELELTHEQLSATSAADLLMVNGVDLEHFLDTAIDSSGFSGTMLVTAGVLTADDVDKHPGDTPLPPESAPNGNYTIDRGVERVDVAPWRFPG